MQKLLIAAVMSLVFVLCSDTVFAAANCEAEYKTCIQNAQYNDRLVKECSATYTKCEFPKAPNAAQGNSADDYEREKMQGCGQSGGTWDYGIRMCHCPGGFTLNAEHTRCIKDERKECYTSDDCQNRAKKIGYECRGNSLYAITELYSCVGSRCEISYGGRGTKLIKACGDKCVSGYCYARVPAFDGSTCESDNECSIVLHNTICNKNQILYTFFAPRCINRECIYGADNAIKEVKQCPAGEICFDNTVGQSECRVP